MPVYIGCDVGTVSVKGAVLARGAPLPGPVPAGWSVLEVPGGDWTIYLTPYRRARGDPLGTAVQLLEELRDALPGGWAGVCATGSGGRLLAERLGFPWENELRSLARAVGALHPGSSQVFEIGGESARFLRIEEGEGAAAIVDYDTNGECAAGTGSFLDQQATRLRYRVEEVGAVALSCEKGANVAGRCSVFAKSDMIHAQQKGASPAEVLRGLCDAVARNFKASVVKVRPVEGPAVFLGGVARNAGVRRALADIFALNGQLLTPEHPAHYGAIGAALALREREEGRQGPPARRAPAPAALPSWDPLELSRVTLLRDRAIAAPLAANGGHAPVYLGVDIGSVSTNLVLTDAEGNLVHEIYLRTRGRPIEAVDEGLEELRALFGERVEVRGVATTGSGRELIGELLGADLVVDEITAHKTGAFHIARRHLGTGVDTIFEIGGQDAKYIHLKDGIVVHFAMNEACAAGTGSFLEEQAEKLGVAIVDEFSRLALSSAAPTRLGERCTVFMERDVARSQNQGAELPDLVAGLAYAVVQNYLNRVVRGRPVGEVVFFQGGTAYNDAVAAAFAQVLGKTVVVPPHNGVVGAYGAALLAQEKAAALGEGTRFRGYRLQDSGYEVRAFACGSCTNSCDIQEYRVEGRRSYWGDKCAEKYRQEARVPREPATADLISLREELLEADYAGRFLRGEGGPGLLRQARRAAQGRAAAGSPGAVGIPRALYAYDRLPFWGTYLRALGFEVRLSAATTKKVADLGVEAAVAEPCFPVQVAHGHVVGLLREGVDRVLLPNVVDAEAPPGHPHPTYLCPWNQTAPFVVAASHLVEGGDGCFLRPTVHFRRGPGAVERQLWQALRAYGFAREHHRAAVSLAYAAQRAFEEALTAAGARALEILERTGEAGIVLVGRPYNAFDKGLNLNVPRKLRSLYGVNVLPLDALPLEDVGIDDLNPNMFWNYGRKILQAARYTSGHPNLHLVYVTNFKCGPDSYLKHFCEDAAGKPFLVLQFDGHGNDAGTMTRCEAYLDSKGILRWWSAEQGSTDEPSTCRGCASAPPTPSLPAFGG
ncbi:MAG: acyl-CoA dehydratase activase [Deferrisomatales bacterium]|nr:acyl-CoA dehydratase activase [Deferrisomatales bacterium]